jgi:hypothetical protein
MVWALAVAALNAKAVTEIAARHTSFASQPNSNLFDMLFLPKQM